MFDNDWEKELRAEDRRYARIQVVCVILMVVACTMPSWIHLFRK